MRTFGEYLDNLRAQSAVSASPVLTNAQTLALVQTQYIAGHEVAVAFQRLDGGDHGPAVYRLGTVIVLQDLTTQLNALVASRDIRSVPGREKAYSCNPSLRV